MKHFLRFLLGWYRLAFEPEKKAEILDFFLTNGLGMLYCDDGEIGILRRDLHALPEELGCRILAECGLPHLLRRLLRRPGTVVGMLVGGMMFCLLSLTVWRVEVSGTDRLSAVEIEVALEKAGLSVGDLAIGVDTAAVRTRFLAENPEVAWIGIYLHGTTVSVEVRETQSSSVELGQTIGLCNLVSDFDAVVESVSADAGRAVVSRGETVRRGDLLISGIYNTATGLVGTSARGEVRGRIRTTVRVVQPLTVSEKLYSEGKTAEFSINFFGKEIKLFKSAGKSGEECDIIYRKERFILPGGLRLPISTSRCVALPYSVTEVALDEEQAVSAAYSRMVGELAARFSDAEVLRETFYGEFGDGVYVLTCEVECIVDIASPLAYEFENTGG